MLKCFAFRFADALRTDSNLTHAGCGSVALVGVSVICKPAMTILCIFKVTILLNLL